MTLTFSATQGGSAAYAYFDKGPDPAQAGLGVCGTLDGSQQCNPSNDDNLQQGEIVTVSWTTAQDLSNLLFNADGHTPLASDSTYLQFSINGGSLELYTFADLEAATFTGVTSMTFAYADDQHTGQQYYIDSAVLTASAIPVPSTSPVPVPAAGFLLLGGIGALAGLRRKRKAA